MKRSQRTHSTEAGFTAALDRIAHEPSTRRELLWLRAMERGDEQTARWVERTDPSVPDRLQPLAARILRSALPNNIEEPGVRREFFLRVHDERFRHHVARILGEPCNCIGCSGIPLAEQARPVPASAVN